MGFVVQVAVMNAALRSASGGVAPGQLCATRSECKSTVPASHAVPLPKRPLSFTSMSASFSPAPAERASHMWNAVANHVTPVVSQFLFSSIHVYKSNTRQLTIFIN